MFAAIDLGSNSFHLLIARSNETGVEQYDRYSSKVQLAEGLVDSGRLSQGAMIRGFECLSELSDHLGWFDVHAINAVGTHALRVASNSREFLEKAEQALGVPIDVLSGEQEAELIYRGVKHSQQLNQHALVIDVGGGSTEFSLGEGDRIDLSFSEQMGCVTLRDQYFPAGRIHTSDFRDALVDVRQWVQLPASQLDGYTWSTAWGSSGTMKAIARILNGLHGCGYVIERNQLHSLTKNMLAHRKIENLNYPGLNDDRKSVILPGIAIVSEMMDELRINELKVSQASLREGLIWRMANEQHD